MEKVIAGEIRMTEKELNIYEEAEKCYKDNFKLDGIWKHYIINPFRNMDHASPEVHEAVCHEIHSNGQLSARQYYVKSMFHQLEKNKTLDDWVKFAKEFVEGFDKSGHIKLLKGAKR